MVRLTERQLCKSRQSVRMIGSTLKSVWSWRIVLYLFSHSLSEFVIAKQRRNASSRSLSNRHASTINFKCSGDFEALAMLFATFQCRCLFCGTYVDKKLIRRWDSERELPLQRRCTRTRKYYRHLHKFRHRSFPATQVYQIQWNNAV